jgi:hypothetical protein
MKSKLMLVLAGSVVATSAFAFTYQWDDGSSENSLGLTAGGLMTWLHAFQVDAGGNNNLMSISLSWDQGSALVGGEAFEVHVWSDPNNDGSPLDAVLLDTAASTVDPGAITNGAVFQTVAIAETVGAPGTWFFVGASMTHAQGQFPAAMDETASQGNAWVNVGGPGNLGGALHMDSIGFPANFLLRADGEVVPEPGTMIAIGAGLAGLLLRRRSK